MPAADEPPAEVVPMPDREPVDPARLAELREGRIFVHRTLTSPSSPGPQFCRVVSWTQERVAFPKIHREADGSERPSRVDPWNVPVRSFFEFDLGRWHDGPLSPVDQERDGYHLPLSAKKPGSTGPGHS